MIFATRADPVVFRQLDLVHDLAATGALLPEALRHLALFSALGPESGLFENGHGLAAGNSRGVDGESAGCAQNRSAFTQSRAGGKDIIDQQHTQTLHVAAAP